MEDEWVKAALVALGLKNGASLSEVRSAYLEKTSRDDFKRVFLGEESLEKLFLKYYKAYLTLLKYHAQSDSAENLEYYPPDQIQTIHFNQGLFHLINQNYLKAMEKFEEAYKISNRNPLVLIYQGIMLLKRKSYYAAEKYFSDAIKLNQSNDDAWFYLAETFYKAKQYRKALNMYETAYKLNTRRRGIKGRINELRELMAGKNSTTNAGSIKGNDNAFLDRPSLLDRIIGIFKKK